MQVSRAIITAAGQDQVRLPLQTVVDRAGNVGTALWLLLDEITSAGIDEIAVVICPGQAERYRQAAGKLGERLTFFEQTQPRGYGDALLRAREFVQEEAFLHLVSDHLYVTKNTRSCVAQLLEVAYRENCSVSAIQATRENKLGFFGAIGGTPVARTPGLFEVARVLEKPTPTVAEQQLIVAGQRAGHYLCLFGMHVLTSSIFDLLQTSLESSNTGEKINLSDALNQLAQSQRYLASVLDGERYNIGEKYGLLYAQLAIALSGGDRDDVLTELVELVAS
jgi:UTP--glucose-1-phosphate uridylyltransferase